MKQFKPGYPNDQGYWRSAKTICCHTWLVYRHPKSGYFVHWQGWEEMPKFLHCRGCNEIVGGKDTDAS